MQGYFDPPLFELSLAEQQVDLADTPYFYNDNGTSTYVKTLPDSAIIISEDALADSSSETVLFGNEYFISKIANVKDNPPYGIETEFSFDDQNLQYQSLWVTQ